MNLKEKNSEVANTLIPMVCGGVDGGLCIFGTLARPLSPHA
jgi:hypothetical protein